MPFVESVFRYQSVAFVGMDKNSGKTEAMNYFLEKSRNYNKKIAVTSIGIDGESTDQVTKTSKPEITLFNGCRFVTSEYFYNKKRLLSKITDVSQDTTSLGRLITADVIEQGRIILSGPASTSSMKRHIDRLIEIGSDLVVVDGALSRLSLASPTVTQSMVLCTGAVLSHRVDEIVKKTLHTVNLIDTKSFESNISSKLNELNRGVYAVSKDDVIDLNIDSVFSFEENKDRLFDSGYTVFFTGVVNDSLLDFVSKQRFASKVEIVVKDFTKLFVSKRNLDIFLNKGARISLLNRSELLAICVNPVSPKGFVLDSNEICSKLRTETYLTVCDVRKI